MLNYKTDNGHSTLEVKGSLATICADVCTLLSKLNEAISEESETLGTMFRFGMTKALVDGMFFDTDRAHMEPILRKAQEAKEVSDDDVSSTMDGLLCALKAINEQLGKVLEDNGDATE